MNIEDLIDKLQVIKIKYGNDIKICKDIDYLSEVVGFNFKYYNKKRKEIISEEEYNEYVMDGFKDDFEIVIQLEFDI